MSRFTTSFLAVTLLIASLITSLAQAQDSSVPASVWNGEWIAEGTLFRIAVQVSDSVMEVVEVESLGFVWTSEAGEIVGNVARVPVNYAGVSGIVQAELVDSTTAVAIAATCMPEFMVVCALAKDRQAIFRKVSD